MGGGKITRLVYLHPRGARLTSRDNYVALRGEDIKGVGYPGTGGGQLVPGWLAPGGQPVQGRR